MEILIWYLILEKTQRTALPERTKINAFCENEDLVDVWRVLNPDSARFTWRQKRPEVHCRLVFFLVNQSILCNTNKFDILIGYKTDHSMITLHFSAHSNYRGKGFWKLNTSFLNDPEYIRLIQSTIQETQNEYANDDYINPNLMWEMLKLKVRERSIKFGATKKMRMAKKQNEIGQLIRTLEKRLSSVSGNNPQKQSLWAQLETNKQELERVISDVGIN